MSAQIDPATATLLAALIGVFGALARVVVGVVLERVLRLIGRLRFEASGWEQTFYRVQEGWGVGIVPAEGAEKEATQVNYRVAIDLFNGKEVPTGLRDIAIVLVSKDGKRSPPSPPRDLATRRSSEYNVSFDELAVINVPPRQFVHKELEGTFGEGKAVEIAIGKWKQVEFVGKRPKRPFLGILGSKTYRKTIKAKPENRSGSDRGSRSPSLPLRNEVPCWRRSLTPRIPYR